tara:strand:+ start:287 stop:481 length:195 start_codon:yes stop_codon:yes gene_type:complete
MKEEKEAQGFNWDEDQIKAEEELEEGCPQHVIDERKVEEAIERMYRSEQQDMFDDPDMNWSGLR